MRAEMKVKSSSSASMTDVQVVTSNGECISVHSSVLSSSSPVLESMIDRARMDWNKDSVIKILGVPSDAVVAFIEILYSYRMESASWSSVMEDVMDEHSLHLLAMSHKYRVAWLKRLCETAIAVRLTPDKAVDILKLAKLCDAPRLYQRCVQIVAKDFEAVEVSDGWSFIMKHDPALELEILRFLTDSQERNRRWRSQRRTTEVYKQLGEAMDCLQHIFSKNCYSKMRDPCSKFRDCTDLKQFIKHFDTCTKKLTPGGCLRCKRMWQLYRLHSSTCTLSASNCFVPFCSHFKIKLETEKQDKTWRLLVKKVVTAKIMASLVSRKRPELVARSHARYTAARTL